MKINLKELLEQKGISRYKLNKDTGVTEKTINRWFFNESNQISLEILEIFCNYLECEVNEIIIKD